MSSSVHDRGIRWKEVGAPSFAKKTAGGTTPRSTFRVWNRRMYLANGYLATVSSTAPVSGLIVLPEASTENQIRTVRSLEYRPMWMPPDGVNDM